MNELGSTPWTDITEAFTFVEETLVYVDAPLEGHLRSREGEVFAFRCSSIVTGKLWHWILLPVRSAAEPVEDVFAHAHREPPARWISIVEDRRSTKPQVMAVLMSGSDAIPR